jgi:diguanylate cyclase (GGDEF)-like protein
MEPTLPSPRNLTAAARGATVLGAALGVAVVGLVDYATGTELRLYPLYFVPTAVTSWRVGRGPGVLLALGGAAAWLAANLLAGLRDSAPWITVANAAVHTLAFVTVALLTAANRSALDRARDAARRDALTGLDNARAFYDRVSLEAARMRRAPGPLVLAYLDLDRFKEVNDTVGHRAGDDALAAVGAVLRQRLRATDGAARLGGDEFGVVLPGTDARGAEVVLEALRRGIADAMRALGLSSTAAIGAVVFEQPGPEVDPMLHAADLVMYEAKAAGRDRVLVRPAQAVGPVAPPAPAQRASSGSQSE